MELDIREKFSMSFKLTTFLMLSIILGCSSIFADEYSDESYFNYLAQINSQKLYKPIELDTSQVEIVAPKINTSIQNTL